MDLTHLHPMIVHFPIALLIVGFLSDLVGLKTKRDFYSHAGFYMFVLGALGVIAAFVSGNLAGDGIVEEGALKQALETHEEAATLAIVVTTIATVFRIGLFLLKKYSGVLKMISLALGLLTVMAIARTGYYGGELVYKHAAGVQLNLSFGTNLPNEQNN